MAHQSELKSLLNLSHCRAITDAPAEVESLKSLDLSWGREITDGGVTPAGRGGVTPS